jgi:hypothetical protein
LVGPSGDGRTTGGDQVTTQEGWHPDPDDDHRLRYWDGSAWTGERVWDGQTWVEGDVAGSVEPPASAGPPPPVPVAAPPQAGAGPDRVNPLLVAALAVVAAVLAAGLTYVLVAGDDDEVTTADSIESTATTTTDREAAPATDRDDESTPSSTTSTTTTTVSGTEDTGQWIAVLASTPVAEGQPAAGQRLTELRGVDPGAKQILSDDFASLNPGFYVTYVPGFATGEAAVAYCTSRGLGVPNQCYGRFLSDDPADKNLQAGT